MMPTLCEGKRWVNGKPNPVTLVNTVVTRKSAVRPLSRLAENIPNRTMNPETIPTKLMITCTWVKVERDMPSIMWKGPPQTGLRYYDEAGKNSTAPFVILSGVKPFIYEWR